MMYLAVGILLAFALSRAGFRPPGTQTFKIINAACAAFLIFAYCPSMQEFWRAFKYPDLFAEPAHIFNKSFSNTVYLIKFVAACVGAVAVFIGFSLAHRKSQGVLVFYSLIPFLIVSSTSKVILGFYRTRTAVSVADFTFVTTVGLCIYAAIFLSMRRFYKRNEEFFFEVRT